MVQQVPALGFAEEIPRALRPRVRDDEPLDQLDAVRRRQLTGFEPPVDVAGQHGALGAHTGQHQCGGVGHPFGGTSHALCDGQHRVGLGGAGDDGDDAAVAVGVEHERQRLRLEWVPCSDEQHTECICGAAHGCGARERLGIR